LDFKINDTWVDTNYQTAYISIVNFRFFINCFIFSNLNKFNNKNALFVKVLNWKRKLSVCNYPIYPLIFLFAIFFSFSLSLLLLLSQFVIKHLLRLTINANLFSERSFETKKFLKSFKLPARVKMTIKIKEKKKKRK